MKTYQPIIEDREFWLRFSTRDYENLSSPLAALHDYERIGIDRLIRIREDLRVLGVVPPASILDIGCNTGLFSVGLARLGYTCVGIDTQIAAVVQGSYPGDMLAMARLQAARLEIAQATFQEADVIEYLSETARTFDVALVLSVAHQWVAGYSQTGVGRRPPDVIEHFFRLLWQRTHRVWYWESPEALEVPSVSALDMPALVVRMGLVSSVTRLGVSPSANGSARWLYRLELTRK